MNNNKKTYLRIALSLVFAAIVSSCGESAEDISFGYDHEPPKYTVLTDSLAVTPLQQVPLKVEITDNEGLRKLSFSYGDWSIVKAVTIEGSPKSYVFQDTITVPADAIREWTESVTLNTGGTMTVSQTYHKLTIEATDVNMNVRTIPIYIKVE